MFALQVAFHERPDPKDLELSQITPITNRVGSKNMCTGTALQYLMITLVKFEKAHGEDLSQNDITLR